MTRRAYLQAALPLDDGGGAAMTQLSIDAAGPVADPTLGQWFTPPDLAAALVGLAASTFDHDARCTLRVLEPSAGRGNLIRAIVARAPGAAIDAIDIDPRWCHELRVLGGCRVHEGDYLARPAPAQRYDLAVTNPPYDGGAETEHLAKLLDECTRIVALLPTRSLHGKARYRRVWHRFDPRPEARALGPNDWHVRQKVHCVSRPAFGESGGTDEIVLLDLRRAPGPCDVRWL